MIRSALYGVVVDSPWPLSPVRGGAGAAADLAIVMGAERPVPDTAGAGQLLGELRAGERLLAAVTSDDDGVLLRMPGHLDAHYVEQMRGCRLHADPSLAPGYLEELVAGPVLADWLVLTGRPVLHGSGVVVGGRAVVIVANSGGGKSTLAAALAGEGATVLTDDIARVEPVDGSWVCHPGPGRLRLRAGAEALAGSLGLAGTHTADGRLAVDVVSSLVAQPMGALVVPVLSREAEVIAVERLRGTAAATALLARPRVASLVEGAYSAALFRLCSEVAGAVPVWQITLPWGPVGRDLGRQLMPVIGELVQTSSTRG